MTRPNELLPAALMPEPPFTDADLVNALDFPDDEVAQATNAARWEITDERSAEWAMRKLAAFKVHIAERVNEATWYRQQIDRWLEDESRDAIRSGRHFENLLADYAYRVRTESAGKTKTVKLPSGEIATRGSEEGKVVLDDATTFLEWVADEVPLDLRHLFTRAEPLPITELRKAVKVTRVLPHIDVIFSDEHVLSVRMEDRKLYDEDEDTAFTCPVCSEPGRTILGMEVIPEQFMIRVNPESLIGVSADHNDILDDPIPGLTYELGDYSVVVKPYV